MSYGNWPPNPPPQPGPGDLPPQPYGGSPTAGRRRVLPIYAAVVTTLLLVVGIAGVAVLLTRSAGSETTGAEPAPAVAPGATPGMGESGASDEVEASEPTESSAATESAPASEPTSSAPATTAPPVSEEEDGLVVSGLPSGSWVAVLDSQPKAESSPGDAITDADSISIAHGRHIDVLDSDSIPGLNAGYWVVAIIDRSSKSDANSACAEVGRDVGPLCYPRQVG